MLDLFSGIGGFHLGLEQAGFKFDWVGFSEIDKYAVQQYQKRFPEAQSLGSITDIQPERDLPNHIDILCGGFPCQAFSIAGKRKGFDDTRGTLFFEIARILRHFRDVGKPIPYFILENVKGLLNHEDGRTFATIYGVLADLGYTVECQLLNTRWFLPQNRERIYLVGHFRGESRPKVFPIEGKAKRINQIFIDESMYRMEGKLRKYNGYSPTLNTSQGGGHIPLVVVERGQYNSKGNIRNLTPTECERLQGFPDGWTEGQSDTQRYKQLGNAVSVPVVKAIGERLNQYL